MEKNSVTAVVTQVGAVDCRQNDKDHNRNVEIAEMERDIREERHLHSHGHAVEMADIQIEQQADADLKNNLLPCGQSFGPP